MNTIGFIAIAIAIAGRGRVTSTAGAGSISGRWCAAVGLP